MVFEVSSMVMSMSTDFISGVWNFSSLSSAVTRSAGDSSAMSRSKSDATKFFPLSSVRGRAVK